MLIVSDLNLTFNENSANERKALKDINLKLNEGEFLTIIGGNGAGKSTLLNCLSGTYLPDTGKIILDDKEIQYEREFKRAGYIGRLFQDPLKGSAPDMSIEENLTLAYTRGKKQSIFEKLFKINLTKDELSYFKKELAQLELGLESRLSAQVGMLSGGQRQALTLIMATLNPPKLLLLDEHTAALDPKTAQKVMEITNDIITKNKITSVMVTHNIKHALNYGNRLIVMKDGKVLLDLNEAEKKELTVEKIMEIYAVNDDELTDRMLLD